MKALRDKINKIVKRMPFLTFSFFRLSFILRVAGSKRQKCGRSNFDASTSRRLIAFLWVSAAFCRCALDIDEEVATGGWIDFRGTVIFCH